MRRTVLAALSLFLASQAAQAGTVTSVTAPCRRFVIYQHGILASGTGENTCGGGDLVLAGTKAKWGRTWSILLSSVSTKVPDKNAYVYALQYPLVDGGSYASYVTDNGGQRIKAYAFGHYSVVEQK